LDHTPYHAAGSAIERVSVQDSHRSPVYNIFGQFDSSIFSDVLSCPKQSHEAEGGVHEKPRERPDELSQRLHGRIPPSNRLPLAPYDNRPMSRGWLSHRLSSFLSRRGKRHESGGLVPPADMPETLQQEQQQASTPHGIKRFDPYVCIGIGAVWPPVLPHGRILRGCGKISSWYLLESVNLVIFPVKMYSPNIDGNMQKEWD